jgi:hypothetical protein
MLCALLKTSFTHTAIYLVLNTIIFAYKFLSGEQLLVKFGFTITIDAPIGHVAETTITMIQ